MLIEQPPLILRWIYPRAMWRMDKNEKSVYLTFDDGPYPRYYSMGARPVRISDGYELLPA